MWIINKNVFYYVFAFSKGFSAEFERVKNLPCGEMQTFTVKFDPQIAKLHMEKISVIMPIQVHMGNSEHLRIYYPLFLFSIRLCNLVLGTFMFGFTGCLWPHGAGSTLCSRHHASHYCFHRYTAVRHCAVWHVSGNILYSLKSLQMFLLSYNWTIESQNQCKCFNSYRKKVL